VSATNGAAVTTDAGASRELFSYEVRREGRPLVILRAVQAGSGPALVVEAEVHRGGDTGTVVRAFPFATAQQARRFVDEALLTLQYLDCDVIDPEERVGRESSVADA
jgi:hypothetical protein